MVLVGGERLDTGEQDQGDHSIINVRPIATYMGGNATYKKA